MNTMWKTRNVLQLSYYVVTEVEMGTPDEIMSKTWYWLQMIVDSEKLQNISTKSPIGKFN